MADNLLTIKHRTPNTEHQTIHVIISHDVDHLFVPSGRARLREFIHPKLWLELTKLLLTGKISLHRFWVIFSYHFKKSRNNIKGLLDFDIQHGVKATYFFGMNNGLGLIYKPEDAKPFIELVRFKGFDAGVHGIIYDDYEGMKMERDTWTSLMGTPPECLRMHYVRYDDNTFTRLSQLGYVYDSTEFYKGERKTIRGPYKVGSMWEFPLNIMECYLPPDNNTKDYMLDAEQLKAQTLRIIDELRAKGINYLTVLFHDPGFTELKQGYRDWYTWLVKYVEESPDFDFMSYREAIGQLERESN